MAVEVEKVKVIEKAIDILKRELSPVEYVRFLEVITPKVGDAAKELRKLRDIETEKAFLERMKRRGVSIR
jgi:hypothetical protein